MKYLNSATITVFSKQEEEDAEKVKQALKDLVPLNLEEEKLAIKEETATGFNEKPIRILSITLTKQAHTTRFLKQLLNKLTKEQKQLLLDQKESRLDNELNFYIRIDKNTWLNERKIELTDSGKCFHIKMHIASFPARRPDALAAVEKIFKPQQSLDG